MIGGASLATGIPQLDYALLEMSGMGQEATWAGGMN
jgi:hypothetical protein